MIRPAHPRGGRLAMEDLADALHSAALEGSAEAWSAALGTVSNALGAGPACMFQFGLVSGRVLVPGGSVVACTDPSRAREYFEHHAARDPVLPRALAMLSPGRALAADQVVDKAEVRRTDFHREWCIPRGVDDLAVGVTAMDGGSGGLLCLAVARAPGAERFGPIEVRRLEALLPHVKRSAATSLRLGAALASRDALADALDYLAPRGALLVDEQGRVVHANRVGDAAFSRPGAPLRRAANGELRPGPHVPAWIGSALDRLLHAATRRDGSPHLSDSINVPAAFARAGRTDATKVSVVPLASSRAAPGRAWPGAAALVVLDDAAPQAAVPPNASCLDRFDLTPAEARVALLLAQRGTGSKALARELGVSPATVRTHLQRALEKTATHSRAALVSLLLHGPEGRPGQPVLRGGERGEPWPLSAQHCARRDSSLAG